MYVRTYTVSLTTNGSGAATGYTRSVTGKVLAIRYVKVDFADGVDFDVTLETTGTVVWDQDNVNASCTVLPRQATHTTAGVAATYDGTYAVLEPVYVAGDRIKVVVGSGGDTKTGTVYVTMG